MPLGRHDIRLGTLSYRVAILERGDTRYYLLYDTSLQIRREHRFAWMLGLMTVAMTLAVGPRRRLGVAYRGRTGGGIWRPRCVTAARMTGNSPLADDFPVGEVGELARVFDRHLIRMRAFIERERAFSADISHELRTALAVILSSTEVLLDDDSLSDKQKARIGRIERAARDMAELGTALLLMAREEHSLAAGGGCVLADVVREVVEKQRHMLAGKPVEVEVHTSPELVLSADAGLVEILVSNLIRNAFSYTAAGTVRGAAGRPLPDRERYRQRHPALRHRPGLHSPLP